MAFQPVESHNEYASGPAEDEEWYVDPVTGERGIVKKAILGGLATGAAAYAYKKYKQHQSHKKQDYYPPPQQQQQWSGNQQCYNQGPPQGYCNQPPRQG